MNDVDNCIYFNECPYVHLVAACADNVFPNKSIFERI